MTTALSLIGLPRTAGPVIGAKPAAGLPPRGLRIAAFDTWRPGYAGMVVEVIEAGTNNTPAPLFYDISLSQPAQNPQTLLSLTDSNGATYGKWAQPIYTPVPYVLYVNSTDSTGVEYPPLIDLAGQDISDSLVHSDRGQYPITLGDFVDTWVVALLFGPLSASAGTAANTATLTAAIGAAAALGGGSVLLPGGTIPHQPITLPEGVVLVGDSLNGTTLQCSESGRAITLGGDGAGLRDLTLDGLNLVSASVGVYGLGVSQPQFDNVVIKRFDQGVLLQGVATGYWRNFSISNCNTGADIRGDADVTNTNAGSAAANVTWDGGGIALCTAYGLRLRFIDQEVREIRLRNIGFVSSTGIALHLHGVRGFTAEGCWWTANITNLLIEDDTNPLYSTNKTERVTFSGGRFDTGKLTFNQSCINVAFDSVRLNSVNYDLSIPSNVIMLRNCIEDSGSTSTGDTTKLVRWSTFDEMVVTGVTVGATPVVAWQQQLQPGQSGLFEAHVVARQRDGIFYGNFFPMAGAYQPGASLPFNTQTANFVAGSVLTGHTSGASARVTAVTQAGGAGTLTIRDITGTFVNGELITDSSGGSARMNGVLTTSNSALDGTGAGALRTATFTGTAWAATFAVSGAQVQLVVTGQAATTIEWTVRVRKTVP